MVARDHRRRRDAIELARQRPGVVAAIAAQRVGDQREALDPVLVRLLVEPGARDHPPARVGRPDEVDLHLVVEVAQPLLHRLVHEAEIGRPLGRLLQRLDQHRVGRHLRRGVDPLARVDLEQQRRRVLRALEARAGLALEIVLQRPRRQTARPRSPAHRRAQRARTRSWTRTSGLGSRRPRARGAGSGTCTVTSLVLPGDLERLRRHPLVATRTP